MKPHYCDFYNDFLYKGSKIHFNKVEQLILDCIYEKTGSEESVAICLPNKNIVFPLINRIVHKDYDICYKLRKDIGRRVSILVVTSVSYINEIVENTCISTNYILNNCIDRQNFYYSVGRYNFMDSAYNAQSYWKDILIKKYRSKKNIPEFIEYKDIFPVALGSTTFNTMSRNYMGNYDNEQQPVYYVTSNKNVFIDNNFAIFDYIFIDYSRINKFIRNIPKDKQVFYFFDTLMDDKLLFLGNSVKDILALDSNLLKQFNFYESDNTASNKTDISKKISAMISDSDLPRFEMEYLESDFDDAIEEAIVRFNNGKKSIGMDYEKKILSQLIINVLTIPVNAIEYDFIACKQVYADSNIELLRELKNRKEIYMNVNLARCMEALEDVFNKYKFDQYCPKQDIILRYIKKNLKDNKKILVVTANKISNISLKAVVADYFKIDVEQLEMKGVLIITRNDMGHKTELNNADMLLLTMCNSLQDINILTKITYKKCIILLYRVEIENIKRKLQSINEKFNNQKNIFFRDKLSKFCKNTDVTLYSQIMNRISCLKVAPKNSELLDLSAIFEVSKRKSFGYIYTEYKGLNAVNAKLIEFDDGSYTFIDVKGYARILSPSQKDIIDEEAEQICAGDNMIFIDGQAHKDLYDIIIKNISSEAKFYIDSLLVKDWREKLEDYITSKEITYKEIYNEMKMKGYKKKSPETVKKWFTGESMGPNNAEDIKALGEVMKVNAFIYDYKLFFNALEEIRIIRRVVARKLNEAIYTSNKKTMISEQHNEMIYGVYLEDIKSAIEVRTVKSIHEEIFRIKPSDVGKCFS